MIFLCHFLCSNLLNRLLMLNKLILRLFYNCWIDWITNHKLKFTLSAIPLLLLHLFAKSLGLSPFHCFVLKLHDHINRLAQLLDLSHKLLELDHQLTLEVDVLDILLDLRAKSLPMVFDSDKLRAIDELIGGLFGFLNDARLGLNGLLGNLGFGWGAV